MPKAWFSNQTLAERLFQGSIQTTESSSEFSRFQHRAQLRSLRKTPGRTIQRHRASFTRRRLICGTLPGIREWSVVEPAQRLSTPAVDRKADGWTRDRCHRVNTALRKRMEIRRHFSGDGRNSRLVSARRRFAGREGVLQKLRHPDLSHQHGCAIRLPHRATPLPKNKNPAIRGGAQSGEERALRRAVEPSDQAGMRSSMSCGSRST